MKKIIIFVFVSLFLTSCFGDSDEVMKAKQEMGIIDATSSFDILGKSKKDEKTKEEVKEEVKEETEETEEAEKNEKTKVIGEIEKKVNDLSDDPRISIKHISGEKILEFDKLDYFKFKKGHEKISGKTNDYVSKIVVNFSNEDSYFPNDEYTLKKFKAGGSSFLYNANSKYKVLDFGLNKYTFTAYTKTGVSITEINVIVSIKDNKYIDGKKVTSDFKKQKEITTNKLIGDEKNVIFAELPEGGDFGNVIKLGEKSFTYSDIKGLEVKKDMFEKINCSKDKDSNYSLTNFLKERQSSWYYWNTCKNIVKENGISFYIIRLDGKKYYYEKHYLDFKHGFYGIYEIKKGQGIDKYNISQKNEELKRINNTFSQIKIVDDLFKKIIK